MSDAPKRDDPKPSSALVKGTGDEVSRLRASIAQTRAEMGGAIEQLHGRLNPAILKESAMSELHDAKESLKAEVRAEFDGAKARLKEEFRDAKAAVREATVGRVENIVASAKDSVRETSHSIVDTITQNPIPVALAGIGLAWLIMGARSSRRERARVLAAGARETNGGETGAALGPEAGRSGLEQIFHDNPLAVGVAVVAIGTAVGMAIPITRREDALLGEARDRVFVKAQELAHGALDTKR